mgnify:FL=1
MSHANISVFIPHMGCPNACSFCNQRTISSTAHAPSPDEAEDIIRGAYEYMSPEKRRNTEIAFFGGSFTAIDREYMISLLERADRYITCENGFCGIRISTRPDCIDEEILMLLKKYHVTAIELGAQSMNDRVLEMNMRGHTSEDIRRSAAMIKSYGFELGLQMMVGLYGSSPADELYTMNEIVRCAPATARIYPVAVLEGTKLAELYKEGKYKLYPFDECVKLCAEIYSTFVKNNIRVIRMGLHAEDGVEQNAVAGFYHPAFGEIVRTEIIRKIIEENLTEGENLCEAPPRLTSSLSGYKRSNRIYFADRNIKFLTNKELPENVISVNGRIFKLY